MADDAESDSALHALWASVLEDCNDEARCARLLDYAVRRQRLPEVAGRYRALAADPEKRDVAQREIDRIVATATQMLVAVKTPRPGKIPLPITWSALGVCAVVLTWLFWAISSR